MRVVTLEYHDVVSPGGPPSGFTMPGADGYKLTVESFAEHLAATADALAPGSTVLTVREDSRELSSSHNGPHAPATRVVFTFDDGGASAYSDAAPMLEHHGWRGHFFMTTDYVGTPGFLTAPQIRELHQRGHVLGSHSASHPTRMSHCSWPALVREWNTSVAALSDVLGTQATVASVPGGYFSREVAEAAAQAGIRVLFTSEPTVRIHRVDGCVILGRFTLRSNTPAATVGQFVAGDWTPRFQQWAWWNAKKLGKAVGGRAYLRVRDQILAPRA